MPDYRNMSSVEALRLAKDKSGLTADEISFKLGVSTAVINRYLRLNGGYSPSLDMIPRLCSVLDNTVLLDWLKAQLEIPKAVPQAKDRADVLTAVANASAALGDVSRLLVASDKTGINAGNAKEIRAGLEEVKEACTTAQAQLQEIAASDIFEHVVLNHICLREPGERLVFSENRRLESPSALLSERLNDSAFRNQQQEDISMTPGSSDFPYGFIESSTSSQKNASLKKVHVSGEVHGLLFSYSIRQEYRNETMHALEIIYTFPVAWHTSLLGMTAVIGKKKLSAQVMENDRAEKNYEKAISSGDSAIMVQKSAKGLYTANVGNIKPGESFIVELHCAQLLRIEQGRIRICVPTVISERYGNGHIHGGLAAHESVTASRDAKYEFGASIAILGDMAKHAVICPSHGIKGQAADGGLVFSIDGTAHLDRDFVLLIEGIKCISLAQSVSKGDEIMLAASFTPILPQNTRSALGLKILADCSGSMEGERIQQAIRGLNEVLLQLSPQDFVSYSMFGSEVRHTGRSMCACSPDTLKKLAGHIASTDADMGGTEMEQALASTFALPLPKSCEAVPVVLLITDGDVWAVDSIIRTAKNSGHRIFAIGVGSSPAESLLREMAEQTGGACEFVTHNENMPDAIVRMFQRMRGCIASDIQIDWCGETLWQSALPKFIFDGETVHCFAIMRSVPDSLPYLRWKADGREYSATAERIEPDSSDDLFRLGKSRQLEETPDEAEKKAIALEYQLVSDCTSLILVHERAFGDKATGVPKEEHIQQMQPPYLLEEAHCAPMALGDAEGWMKGLVRKAFFSGDEDLCVSDTALNEAPCLDGSILSELAEQWEANVLRFSSTAHCMKEILKEHRFEAVREFLDFLRESVDEHSENAIGDEALWSAFMLWVFGQSGVQPSRHSLRLIKAALSSITIADRAFIKKVCDNRS